MISNIGDISYVYFDYYHLHKISYSAKTRIWYKNKNGECPKKSLKGILP